MSETGQVDGSSADPALDPTAVTAPGMERIAAGVVLTFGVLMLVGARTITVRNETGGMDPRWWPTVIAAGTILCGMWMLGNALLRVNIEREVEAARRTGWIQMIATVCGIAVVLFTWNLGVSFVLLGPAFLMGLNWIYGLRKWTSLLLFPGIIALLLYTVFQLLLRVPL